MLPKSINKTFTRTFSTERTGPGQFAFSAEPSMAPPPSTRPHEPAEVRSSSSGPFLRAMPAPRPLKIDYLVRPPFRVYAKTPVLGGSSPRTPASSVENRMHRIDGRDRRQGRAISRYWCKVRGKIRLPGIVDSRLRGNDVTDACAVIPGEPVPAKAGSGNPQTAFGCPVPPRSRSIRNVKRPWAPGPEP